MSVVQAKSDDAKELRNVEKDANASVRGGSEYEKDGQFYCSPLVIIRVEGCLFRIPQELLESHSEVFRTMFTLPTGVDGEESGEGRLESKPLYLEGVKKEDFRHFLVVLSALNYEGISSGKTRGKTNLLLSRFPLYHDLNTQHWVSVLRLANMWNFDNVRAKAMRMLEEDKSESFDVLDRLKLAYELDITASSWLLPLYRHLVRKESAITSKEAPWLSEDFLKKITRLREERLKSLLISFLAEDTPRPTCYKCKQRLYKPVSADLVLSGGAPLWSMHCKSCNITIPLEEVIHQSPALEKAVESFDADLDRLIDLYLPTSKED